MYAEDPFWKRFEQLKRFCQGGDRKAANALIAQLFETYPTGDLRLDTARRELLDHVSRMFDLDHQRPAPLPLPPRELPAGSLPAISPDGVHGISLVTCCMNREANLLKALGSWLACDDISEIIIVDWSSDAPVRDVLTENGIDDPRILVARVEGEPRWILSYAFNVGFRLASCNRILKVDADIVLDPDFFRKNRLERETFIAGNWRRAGDGQEYVNGFFYLYKSDLAGVGGFNEYITTYGWDDDDIYDRLDAGGTRRRDIDHGTIHHLPHSDEHRLGAGQPGGRAPSFGQSELRSQTIHNIRQNRFLAHVMPYWTREKTPAPFQVQSRPEGSADIVLRRDAWLPNPVPAHVRRDAEYYADLEMTAWRLGKRVFELDRGPLATLLKKPFPQLGKLDVETLLAGGAAAFEGAAGYLVIDLSPDLIPGRNPAGDALAILLGQAARRNLVPVLTGPFLKLPDQVSAVAEGLVYIQNWHDIGSPAPIGPGDLDKEGGVEPPARVRIALDADTVAALAAPAPAAPAVAARRPRLFVDGQHGLGNRLRAIGSAAAIAQKSGHELVIVWQPDSHCDCRFGDLFDHDGAVIEESFVKVAKAQGLPVWNYMEVEPGAEKDAPVTLDDGDLYARSAYVLNHPFSTWDDENHFLRGLRPVAAVRDMVASVRAPNDVSAHVRMAGGQAYEHLPYEQSGGNWTEEGHRAIAHWREKSHFRHFFQRLDTLTTEGRADRIFVAADLPETYAEFRAVYGDRVAMLERAVYDRSAEQLRHALADAILLGTSPLLLGSSWSSFSELAMRLAPHRMALEMSGKDF